MIYKWRLKVLAKISIFLPKSQSLAAVHHLASPNEFSTDTKPHKSFPFRACNNQEQLKQTRKPTFLNPQIVLNTLQNSPSDLIALSFFLWCARQPHYFHDKLAFRYMVGVVSNLTHIYGTVKGILQELESVGCVTKAQTLLFLMRIYWCGAMYDMVCEAFEEMSNYGYIPNTYARNIVMDVLFKIKHVDTALKVLKETPTPNFLSFSIAICNLCRLNDVDNVKSVLRCMLMKDYYMNPETYTFVLNCFCKFARLDEALQLLGMMIVLGAPISVNSWSILIDGFCKSGRIEVAASLLKKMIEMGCSPNIVTCTSLVKGFLESRNPEKACEILGILESQGGFPDLVLCNVLIDGLAKMGWFENAFEVFCSLQERRLTPDVYTYSSLFSTICLSRQYDRLPLLTSGLAVQLDLVVCNSLLSYFCKAGCPGDAIKFYDYMIGRGFLPDKYTFAGVLSALCRLGRIREAVNVYKGMIRSCPSIDAHIHTIMIKGLKASGNLQAAMGLLNKAVVDKFPLDAVSYSIVIDGLIRDRRRKDAYHLFSRMKEMDVAPDKRSYNLILSGFCKDRDVNMVKHVTREMSDRDFPLDVVTYNVVIDGLIGDGQMKAAYDLFSQMKEKGVAPNKRSYYLILTGLCKDGDVDKVKQVGQEMIDRKIGITVRIYKLLKILRYSSHSRVVRDFISGLRKSGLLPKFEQVMFVKPLRDSRDVLDSGTSS